MKPQSNYITRLRRKLEQWGPAKTCHLLVLKVIGKLTLFKILRGMRLLKVDPAYLVCPAGYTPGFLSDAQLRQFASDAHNEMDASFLREALAKGDRCYAILDGDKLAAYGWYSRRPTRIDPPDLLLDFDPDYVYMYKGLTHPDYRGQRGIISYVESDNFDSLKSCARLGYQIFGAIYLLRVFDRYVRLYSPGCREHGFALREVALRADGWGARKA